MLENWPEDKLLLHKRADIIFTYCRDSVLTMEQSFNCTWFVEGDFLVWQTTGDRLFGSILITGTSCAVFIKIAHKIWTCPILNRVKDMLDMHTGMWSVFTCQALHPLGTVQWNTPFMIWGGFHCNYSRFFKTNSKFSPWSWSSESAFSPTERHEYEKSLSWYFWNHR